MRNLSDSMFLRIKEIESAKNYSVEIFGKSEYIDKNIGAVLEDTISCKK